MKHLLSLCVFAFVTSIGMAFAQDVGATAKVPGHDWVEVMNPQPVKSVNSEFGFGETCSIQFGGTVKIFALNNDRLLVNYTAPGESAGAQCPSRTIFFIKKAKFAGMTAAYERVKAADEQRREEVQRLLQEHEKGCEGNPFC